MPPVRVAVELRKVQRLRHHALAGEGRVAVDQHGDHALALGVAQAVLLGPHDAFHHRVHRFQVAGIGRDRDHDLAAAVAACARRWRPGDTSRRPSPACWPGSMSPSNSREDLLHVLADDVGQHVEAAAVRHADHHFVDVVGGRALQQSRPEWRSRSRRLPARSASGRRSASAGSARTPRRRSGCAECAGASRRSSGQLLASGSMRCCSQRFCSGTWMFMYSQPILPQ